MKEISVLFLDDEESVLSSVKRLLFSEPFDIVTTTDYEEALTIIAKEKIKVVFSDERMPKISGVKFLEMVKERHPDIVRILFTGYTDIATAEKAINIGEIYRFINKPWNSQELKQVIHQAMEHHNLVISNRDLLEATKKKNEELEIANKKLKALYEVQREFTSTVSHELRTPLASIKTAIDLVMKRTVGEVSAEQEDVLGRAKNNVDRLKRLVDNVLDLTKMEEGKLSMNFGANDINHLITEVVASQKDVAQSKGLSLSAQLDSTMPKVVIDSDRIMQVLNNLINNAIKFTVQGGITISSQNHFAQNHIVIKVSDTGKGIAEKDLLKLFEKFQQVESAQDNESGGTGLGLAISREIIHLHGGKIWVESTLGQGTSFFFNLPLQERRVPSI